MRRYGILLAAEIRRYLLELRMYWSNYVSDLILTSILIAMFALSTDARSNSTAWLGYFLWTASSTMITESSVSISTDKQDSTFTQLMLKPTSLFTQIMVKTLTWSLVAIVIDALFIAGLFALLRIPMAVNWPIIGLCLIILVGLFGFTLIFVALIVVYTRTQSYSSLFTYILMLVSGMVVPLSLLPRPVMWLGRILPLQYGYELIQRAWTRPVAVSQLLIVSGQSLIYLLIGYLLFSLILRRGRKNGINMRY